MIFVILLAFNTIGCYADREDEGALFLSQLGKKISTKNRPDLHAVKPSLDGRRFRYFYVKDVIPNLCEKAVTGTYQPSDRVNRRVDVASIIEACTYLQESTMRFLIGFGHHVRSQGHLSARMPGPEQRFTADDPGITYTLVEWTVPWICEKTDTERIPEIDLIKTACKFFYEKVSHFLLMITINPDARPVVNYPSSDQSITLDQAEPYIPILCEKAEEGAFYGILKRAERKTFVEKCQKVKAAMFLVSLSRPPSSKISRSENTAKGKAALMNTDED